MLFLKEIGSSVVIFFFYYLQVDCLLLSNFSKRDSHMPSTSIKKLSCELRIGIHVSFIQMKERVLWVVIDAEFCWVFLLLSEAEGGKMNERT